MVQERTRNGAETSGPPTAWRLWLALALALVSYLALRALDQLRVEWTLNAQYAYGWAVPFLCAWLFWRRKAEGGGQRAEVSAADGLNPPSSISLPPSGAPLSISCTSAFQYLSFSVFSILFILLFAFLGTRLIAEANPDWRLVSWALALEAAAGALWFLHVWGGRAALRQFAFPILFFLVAVPWPSAVEQPVIQLLTRGIVAVTAELMQALGLVAVIHGNVIETARGWVDVDEACSGIRSLQAALMLALFFGEWQRLSVGRRAALCGAAFALACVFNLARTLTLSLVAAQQGTTAVQRWHDPAGTAILLGCFGGVWAAAAWLGKRQRAAVRGQESEASLVATSNSQSSILNPQSSRPSNLPLRLDQGEPDATLAHQMGEGLGVRAGGEVSISSQNFQPVLPPTAAPSSDLRPPTSDVCSSHGPAVPWSRGLIFAVLILFAGEMAIHFWYANAPRAATADWQAVLPRERTGFRAVELPRAAVEILRFNEGESGAWVNDDGTRWQMISLRWFPGRVAVSLARNHTPEICLPAAGKKLSAMSGPQSWAVAGVALPFRCFTTEQNGRPLFVFYTLWEEGATEQNAATEFLTWSARGQAVREQRRNPGQRVIQIAIGGARDAAHAEELLRAELPRLIRPQLK